MASMSPTGFLVIGEDAIELHHSARISLQPQPVANSVRSRRPVPDVHGKDLPAGHGSRTTSGSSSIICGQCLLGRNLTQTILILDGPGNASKGTLSNIVQQVIGERNCYELRTDHLSERFEVFRYIGRTMLYGADVEPGFLRTEGAQC